MTARSKSFNKAVFVTGARPTQTNFGDLIDSYADAGSVVSSVNTLVGDVVFVAGTNITLTPSGNNITITAAGSSGIAGSIAATQIAVGIGTNTVGGTSHFTFDGHTLSLNLVGASFNAGLLLDGDAGHTSLITMQVNNTSLYTMVASSTNYTFNDVVHSIIAMTYTPGAAGTNNLTLGTPLVTLASATNDAGLNVPHGTAPTSPANGDVWTTTAGFFARINGSTVGPFGTGGGGGGVSSLNSLTGGLTLVAGSGVTITPSGSNITIDAPGGGSGVSTVNTRAGAVTLIGTDLPVFIGDTSFNPLPNTNWPTEVFSTVGSFDINTSTNTRPTPNVVAVSYSTGFSGYGSLSAMLNNAGVFTPGSNIGIIGLQAANGGLSTSNMIAVAYDLGTALSLVSYIVGLSFAGTANNLYGWILEGSNDDATWNTVDTQTSQNIAGTTSVNNTPGNVYDLSAASTAYRYWRLRFTDVDPAPVTAVQIKLNQFNLVAGTTVPAVGTVPAPALGDAGNHKVLGAGSTWVTSASSVNTRTGAVTLVGTDIPDFIGDGETVLFTDCAVFIPGNDSTTNPNDYGTGGTFTGTSLSSVPGPFNNALGFSGSSTLISTGNAVPAVGTGGSWTVAFWMKTTSSSIQCIMASGQNFGTTTPSQVYVFISAATAGAIGFNAFIGGWATGSGVGSFQSTSTVNDGLWHFVICEKTPTNLTIEIDGSVSNTVSITDFAINNYTLSYGTDFSAQNYVGDLAEMQFYSRALTSGEKLQLFTEGFNSFGGLTPGAVPAPSLGDAALGKVLGAGGAWVLPGVIGTAAFNPSSGAIVGLSTSGIISGVTYVGTGQYQVTFASAQPDVNYTVAMQASDDNIATTVATITGDASVYTVNGFKCASVNVIANSTRDAQVYRITVFRY